MTEKTKTVRLYPDGDVLVEDNTQAYMLETLVEILRELVEIKEVLMALGEES